MYDFNTTITANGESVFMQIISTSGTAYFSRLIFSENNYVGQEHSLNILTFDGVFDSRSASATIIDSRNIKVSAAINAPTQDNTLYSIGVVVRYQGLDYLAAVCTTSNPMPISQGAGNTYSFNVNISVSSTENITVVGTTAAALYDTDIADNLVTVDPTKVLSANMGHALADNLAANEKSGAKNQLPYPYYQTTKTENDITFTDVGDGTITVSGVASAGVTFYLTNNYTGTPIKQGVYKVNGCPINGGATSYRTMIEVYNTLGQTVSTHYDDGEGVEISVAENQSLHLSINVYSGVDLSTPITFKPMICDARVIDPTFAPYAETNLQLTQNKAERSDLSTIHATGSTNTTGAQINAGSLFYLNGTFCKALTNIAVNATFTLNTNYRVDTVANELTRVESWGITPENYAYSTNTFEFYRAGKVVYFSGCDLSDTLPAGSSTIIASLPVELRPIKTWQMRGLLDPLNPNDYFALSISSNGSIEVYRYTANSANTVGAFSQSGSYIANN